MLFSALNVAFVLICVIAAAVQWNDPDPWAWILFYLGSAAVALLASHSRSRWPLGLLLLVCLLWGCSILLTFPEVQWMDVFDSLQMQSDSVEEARELGGLMLVAIWSLVLLARRTRQLRTSGEL